MKKENYFYLLVLFTVVLLRMYIALFPSHIIINGAMLHHFWIGLAAVVLAMLISKKYNGARIIIAGIGCGLLADELAFMIMGAGSFPQYWSLYSVIGAVLALIVVYHLRKEIFDRLT